MIFGGLNLSKLIYKLFLVKLFFLSLCIRSCSASVASIKILFLGQQH